MKTILYSFSLLLLSLLLLTEVNAQYAIGETSLNLFDAARGVNVPIEVYYPATSAGTNTPIAGAAGEVFPVVSFGHGFNISVNAYDFIRDVLVPEGYIFALPNTNTGFSVDHADFGLDLAFAITGLQAEGANSASTFFNKIASTSAVMGHSMGGGSAFLAAAGDPNITTNITLAAAETTTSAIGAAASINNPSLVIAGENDCVSPPNGNQIDMYDNIPSACKVYMEIDEGFHCQFTDGSGDAGLCYAGEGFSCLGLSAINLTTQQTIVTDITLPWLNYWLKDDCPEYSVIESYLTASVDFTYNTPSPIPDPTFCENPACVAPPAPAELALKVILEGPFDGTEMSTGLNTNGLIPLSQPYGVTPWNYAGTESVTSIGPDIVDWVLVELRSTRNCPADEIIAALLDKDGNVWDVDGTQQLKFTVPSGDYYIVVRHRGHLDVMSQPLVTVTSGASFDFSTSQGQAYAGTAPQMELIGSTAVMYAGDFNGDGVMTLFDFNDYITAPDDILQYQAWEVDFNGHVTVNDYNLYRKNASVIGIAEIQCF